MKMKKFKNCTCPDIADNTVHKIGVVLVDNKKTIVVKKKDLNEYISLGGKHAGSESPIDCIQREAQEELGIEISDPQYLGRFEDLTPDNGSPIILDAYLAKFSGSPKPAKEISEYLWVNRNYQRKNIPLGSIIRKFIIPELIQRNLM